MKAPRDASDRMFWGGIRWKLSFKSFRDFLGGGRAEHLQEYVEVDHMNLS